MECSPLGEPLESVLFSRDLRRLPKNYENAVDVILNEVENLINSTDYKFEILPRTGQNDILGQPHSIKPFLPPTF